MTYKFTKMHGCGNDYIYFNCFEQDIADPNSLSIRLSDRHFGVGGDGIVLICPSDIADAKMRMFNADGSEGKMCGNAIRCVGKYLWDNGIVKKHHLNIETLSGIKILELSLDEKGLVSTVRVDMGKPIFDAGKIPVSIDGVSEDESVLGKKVKIADGEYVISCVSMGNPHCVVFVGSDFDLAGFALEKTGPLFENDRIFPERVNTEFAKLIGKNHLSMRVWERGSGETFACGTGACAVAVAAVKAGLCGFGEKITVELIGGNLDIEYTPDGVFMTGPAQKVFDGCTDAEI